MSKNLLALALIAGTTASAVASTVNFTTIASVTFNNKRSMEGVGNAANDRDTWVSPAGGTITGVRVQGSLTNVIDGNWASEARVRISAGAGNSFTTFNALGSTVSAFSGTVAVDRSNTVTPFSLAAGGTVNFEWFESFSDGAGADAVWDTVTYDFGGAVIQNGNFTLGAAAADGVTRSTAGSNVSGGLDFYTITIPYGVTNLSHYLNIKTSQPVGAAFYDSELAIYDAAGNRIADDDDGAMGAGLYSMLSFGDADPLADAADPSNTGPGESGASLAAGTYTIVVGGYDTAFGATIGSITAGAAAGAYSLDVTYVPAPGAVALMGLAGLVAGRRRR
jgi:hypothetical protein